MAEGRFRMKTEIPANPRKVPQPLVARPLRETELAQDPVQFRQFFISLASRFPDLKKSLIQAAMNYTPAGYAKAATATAAYITALLLILGWIALRNWDASIPALILLAPALYIFAFFYAMSFPAVRASMRAKRMEQELVFAGRHMLIEIKGGVPLFDAMLGISRDYGEVSHEFNRIVEKVTLGVPLGVALHEVADTNPSQYFRRMVLQMANSLASGSDVAVGLESVLDQISKEQAIALKAYGQKLNPLVMFFMIFGIIMPSLGVALLVIMTAFLGGAGVSFGPAALFGVLAAVALVQFIFLSMVENSRPKFDIY